MRVNINFNDETYIYLKNPSRRKIAGLNSRLSDKVGTCRVSYSRVYYNEFDFEGWEDFKYKILPCIEDSMLGDFS